MATSAKSAGPGNRTSSFDQELLEYYGKSPPPNFVTAQETEAAARAIANCRSAAVMVAIIQRCEHFAQNHAPGNRGWDQNQVLMHRLDANMRAIWNLICHRRIDRLPTPEHGEG